MRVKTFINLMLVISTFFVGIYLNPALAEASNVLVYKYEYKEGKFDIEYPHFDGMINKVAQEKINGVIQERVDQFIKGNQDSEFTTTAKMKYEVHLNEGNLLSFSINSYIYSGGAHGSASLAGYTFDLSTGERYSFKDRFNFDRAGRDNINRIIAQQIRERDIKIFEPFKGIGDKPNFYLEEGRKVVIIFQQYEIAPYSSGILKFKLQY